MKDYVKLCAVELALTFLACVALGFLLVRIVDAWMR